MAVTTSTTPVREGAPRSRPTTPTEKAAAEAGSDMVETISGMIYSGSYALAYGVVYAAVSVAQSLPQENRSCMGSGTAGKPQSTSSARADGSPERASISSGPPPANADKSKLATGLGRG